MRLAAIRDRPAHGPFTSEALQMKKLLPVVISGVMAISFSQLAAAQAVGVQGPAGTGANVDLNNKGSTEAQKELGQSRQQPGSDDTQSGKQKHDAGAATGATAGATTGASADSSTKSGSEDTNSSSGQAKSNKMEGDSSSAGASQGYDKDKDKDKDRDQRGKNKGVSKNKDKDQDSSTSGSSSSGSGDSGNATSGGASSVTK